MAERTAAALAYLNAAGISRLYGVLYHMDHEFALHRVSTRLRGVFRHLE
jgi:hypothetical protein